MNANTNATCANTNKSERIINLIIVDESGSMYSIYEEALSGINRTIENIKSQADEIDGVHQYINLITFDTGHYKQLLRHCPANEARILTNKDYIPHGGTPLFDAIGRAVCSLERHITENDAVFVTIITDGCENSSTEFTGKEIKRIISRLTNKGWLFTFIGANQDVIENAATIGISAKMCMSFEANSYGTQIMWENENKARTNLYKRMAQSKSSDSNLSMSQIMMNECKSDNDFYNE